MKAKRNFGRLICAIILIIVFTFSASAVNVPYLGYEYNTADESVPAPVGYEPYAVYYGSDMGSGSLLSPFDMCFYGNELYILDSGNSRIVICDKDLKYKREIGKIDYKGKKLDYEGATGLYVCNDGKILISDTKNMRIIECNGKGKGTKLFTKPDTAMIADTINFNVKKAIRDTNGVTYAIVDGINDGAVTFLSDGSFGGFFASNEVEKTAEVILNYVWKKFLTEEQIRNSKSAAPASITNFDVAEKGFIYTVTQSSDRESSVRLLNFKGSNLETNTKFGDLEWDRKIKNSISTTFCDVDVDSDNYVYLLDSARGRVFVYSQDEYLITVFGGKGDKLGEVESTAAVETYGDRVYVLDDIRGCITVYKENEYVKTVKAAANLLHNGRFIESKEYFEKVLKMNSNSTIANYGIGMALDEAGEYSEALKYFKLAYDNENYSHAFKQARRDYIKKNFLWIIALIIVFIAAVILLIIYLKKKFGRKNSYEKSSLDRKYIAPLFTVFHPIDGYGRLKKEKQWSLVLSLLILALLFLGLTAKWLFTGFSFNENRAIDYNLFVTFLQAFLIVFVTAIANWAVCTLIEGKGKLIDIFCMLVYSLLPYVVSIFLYVVFSNVLCQDESAFLNVITVVGATWSAALIYVGFMTIHEFSFKKTALSIVMTAIGIAIIIFLAILFVGLIEQVISFVKAVSSEAVMMG
ncbi:MAG: YIP1 family protein [Clostridia bacterium]|nr:YIP1 family protein [Clostridia bacterium]